MTKQKKLDNHFMMDSKQIYIDVSGQCRVYHLSQTSELNTKRISFISSYLSKEN